MVKKKIPTKRTAKWEKCRIPKCKKCGKPTTRPSSHCSKKRK